MLVNKWNFVWRILDKSMKYKTLNFFFVLLTCTKALKLFLLNKHLMIIKGEN